MARDVEVDVTANDKTGPGLSKTEKSFRASQKKIEDDNKKHVERLGDTIGKGLATKLEKVAPQLAQTLGKGLGAASEYATPILVGGIVAASPLIAAAISGAVIGGIGIGVAGIGVALVAQDARVQAAGQKLGQHLMDALHQDASPFVQPVLDGIATIEKRFDTIEPAIRNIFKNSSQFVAPLVDGVTKGVAGIVRGIDSVVANARPVIDAFSDSFAELGNDVGDFFTTIGQNSDDAALAIRDISGGIGDILDVVGPLISGLTQVYGVLSKIGAIKAINTILNPISYLAGLLDSTDGKLRAVGDSADATGSSFENASDDTTDYAQSMRDAEAAVEATYQAQRDLYQANTSVAQAFADATAQAKKHKATLDLTTQAGRDNRDSLSNVAEALQRDYDGYVKVNGVGAGSAKLAGQLRDKFVALAEKMGASAGQAKALANQLLNIPNVNRHVNVATGAAKKAADDLKAKLASIKNRSVYVQVAFNEGRINKVEQQLARLGNHNLSAGDGGFAGGTGGGRVGGANTPISLQSTVNVALDGAPVRAIAAQAVRANNDVQRWRARSGARA